MTVVEAASLLGEKLFGGAMNGAEIAWQHISSCNVTIPVHEALLRQAKALYPTQVHHQKEQPNMVVDLAPFGRWRLRDVPRSAGCLHVRGQMEPA